MTRGPEGLVPPVGDHEARRIGLKKAFADGSVAVDLDPLSLLSRLAASVFGLDVLSCPRCEGRMRLLAMVTEPKSLTRYLRALGEPTDVPARAPARGPPHWKSRVLRRAAGEETAA